MKIKKKYEMPTLEVVVLAPGISLCGINDGSGNGMNDGNNEDPYGYEPF